MGIVDMNLIGVHVDCYLLALLQNIIIFTILIMLEILDRFLHIWIRYFVQMMIFGNLDRLNRNRNDYLSIFIFISCEKNYWNETLKFTITVLTLEYKSDSKVIFSRIFGCFSSHCLFLQIWIFSMLLNIFNLL